MLLLLRLFFCIFIVSSVVLAQSTETIVPAALDSLQDASHNTVTPSRHFEEQILQTIRIEAIIEKPSVTLIPRRIETSIKSEPLPNRSFEKELTAKPQIILEYGKHLESGKRIQKFKKVLDNDTK